MWWISSFVGVSRVTLKTCPVDISQMRFFFEDTFFLVQEGPIDQIIHVLPSCGGDAGDLMSAPIWYALFCSIVSLWINLWSPRILCILHCILCDVLDWDINKLIELNWIELWPNKEISLSTCILESIDSRVLKLKYVVHQTKSYTFYDLTKAVRVAH